ncbi:SCO7613 C-terminal domain-containing membrane protein [Nonomuraea cavernae]|uniref:SCO7613 C-terminal domain-containing membrane protein n=1 Tax=Nonomuraea cavernae TaxID=2045107 RepID=UPI0033D07DC5
MAGDRSPAPESTPRCPECALPLWGPIAHELWRVDEALAGIRIQETRLLTRREELLGSLRDGRVGEMGPYPGAPAAAGQVGHGGAVTGVRPREVPAPGTGAREVFTPGTGAQGVSAPGTGAREVSAGAVQNLLLILGGLLLTVAAVVFTVVSWGLLGIGGRAAVLAGFTALALAAPAVLVRRGLTATAETVAGIAIALLLLDGYAARRVGLLGADAVELLDYAAGVCGLIALVLMAYARVVPLRGPAPVAVVLAQPVLPLLIGDASATWLVAMLVATAALDVALVRQGRAGVRTTAALCGSAVATLALLGGVPYALSADSAGQALGRSAPLIALALLGAFVARSLARPGKVEGEVWASLVTVGTTLALIAALAAPAQSVLSTDWRPLAYLVPALVVALAATWLPWRRVRLTAMATGGSVALLTALTLLPRLVATLVTPLAWLDTLWRGTWDGGPWPAEGMRDGGPWLGEVTSPVDVVVLGALAAGLLVAAVRLSSRGVAARAALPGSASGGRPVRTAVIGALVSGTLAVTVAPAAFAMAHPAAVAVQVVLAAALAVAALLARTPWWAVACAVVAGAASVEAVAYAFGSKPATLIALPILAVPAAAVALAGRVTALRVWGLGAAVLLLGLDAMAVGLAVGAPVRVAASVGCAVAGVLLLGRSLWAGRAGRDGVNLEWLRYTGTALLLLASWLRLWAGEVTVVEAYTVPCSLVLLGFGWWRRRSAPVSSWAAYGAGLSFTMLPSMVAVYADTEWRRSLALGVLALAVLLAGARSRLQAPTVIGGVTLAGVVVRELAPYVSEMLLTVPRWVPIAVGGLLLVLVGATYEARKRDLKRLRDSLARMD